MNLVWVTYINGPKRMMPIYLLATYRGIAYVKQSYANKYKKLPFREYNKELFKKSKAKNSSKPSLLRALSFCFGWKYLLLSIIILIQECGVKYVQ